MSRMVLRVAKQNLTPVGMTKTGTFTPTQSFSTVTGWTAESGSTVTSNGLVIPSTGIMDVVLSARILNSSASQTRTTQLRLRRAEATLADSGTITVPASDGTYTVSALDLAVTAGDIITVEQLMSSLGQITFVAHTDSWLRATP